jgi:RimJ/RimL family protein N-acetyltransferase
VRLACNETNLRSIGVAERCKMTREGRLRENKRNPDGTYSSSLIYGLLRSEYQAD